MPGIIAASSRDAALVRLGSTLRESGYAFVTPTPATHARVNARSGNEWARDAADVFGWSRPFRDAAIPGGMLSLMQDSGIAEPFADGWRATLRLSSLNGDLFWHSAFPTSAPDSVFFGPDTYRFVGNLPPHAGVVRRAVDICSGAGPGAIAVARHHPGAVVMMADINDEALRLSRVNAQMAGLPMVSAHHSNLLAGVEGDFDLVVANPPYLLDRAERTYRHGGGELGAGLSLAIVDAAIERLSPGGVLVLYTGVAIVGGADAFLRAATSRLAAAGMAWTYRELDPDVFGEELEEGPYAAADRIAAVLLTATKHR